MYNEIKRTVTQIVIGFLALTSFLVIILAAKTFYVYINTPKYTKAVCQVNEDELEIKINRVKKINAEQYFITDNKDKKWLLSTQHCIFK